MVTERSNNGHWKKVYPFEDLEVGHSVEVTGVEGNIRSAATMWGTRYGIWLRVTKIDDGIMRVTRMEAPSNIGKKRRTTLHETLKLMTELLVEIKSLLEEKK